MRKVSFVLVGLGIVFLLTACCGPTRVEMDYGTSYKLAKFNQIVNPDAEKNLEPVLGFDGGAARMTIDRYQKEFEKTSPPASYIFNVGVGGGSR